MSWCEDYIDPFPRECEHGVPDGVRCGECAAEMENVYSELAESVLTAPIEDLEEEIRAEGRDPEKVAEEVREVMKSAVRKCLALK